MGTNPYLDLPDVSVCVPVRVSILPDVRCKIYVDSVYSLGVALLSGVTFKLRQFWNRYRHIAIVEMVGKKNKQTNVYVWY